MKFIKKYQKITILGFAILIVVPIQLLSSSLQYKPFQTFAQTGTLDDLLQGFKVEEQITLNISPLNPRPNSEINMSLEAYGTDLNKADISWSVNGSLKSSGTGVKTFTTPAGSFGETLNIQVRIKTEKGEVVNKTASISTQDIDIIWEADSYTPAFYKGRPLYGHEGVVTLVAMPNLVNKKGVKLNPSTLIYKWIVDDRVLGSKSGYGKNVLEYTGSILGRDNLIEVEVTAPDGTSGRGITLLSIQDPRTILYENNPLYGVLSNKAVMDGYTLKDKDIRVEAFPYFHSAASKSASNLNYAWYLNGDRLPVLPSANSAVFRNTNNQSGSTEISVVTENISHSFQRSETKALLNF